MTSSSGSALPFRMMSNSPVEKPVTERSKSRSQGSQLGQLQLQDIKVPARPERDLVIGDPQCALLRLAQPLYVNGWDLGEPHGFGSHEASMAGNNASVGISQDGVYEAKLSDGCDDLIYLLFGMRPRIARIRSKRAHRAIGHRERRQRIGRRGHLVVPRLRNRCRTLGRRGKVQGHVGASRSLAEPEGSNALALFGTLED